MSTKLSVNINKIATLRNARGGNVPDLLQVAKDIQKFGAQGITIHPRPDERHVRYQDARDLKSIVYTEFNIEGNPQHNFIDLVLECKPTQVTLVPDAVALKFLDNFCQIGLVFYGVPTRRRSDSTNGIRN